MKEETSITRDNPMPRRSLDPFLHRPLLTGVATGKIFNPFKMTNLQSSLPPMSGKRSLWRTQIFNTPLSLQQVSEDDGQKDNELVSTDEPIDPEKKAPLEQSEEDLTEPNKSIESVPNALTGNTAHTEIMPTEGNKDSGQSEENNQKQPDEEKNELDNLAAESTDAEVTPQSGESEQQQPDQETKKVDNPPAAAANIDAEVTGQSDETEITPPHSHEDKQPEDNLPEAKTVTEITPPHSHEDKQPEDNLPEAKTVTEITPPHSHEDKQPEDNLPEANTDTEITPPQSHEDKQPEDNLPEANTDTEITPPPPESQNAVIPETQMTEIMSGKLEETSNKNNVVHSSSGDPEIQQSRSQEDEVSSEDGGEDGEIYDDDDEDGLLGSGNGDYDEEDYEDILLDDNEQNRSPGAASNVQNQQLPPIQTLMNMPAENPKQIMKSPTGIKNPQKTHFYAKRHGSSDEGPVMMSAQLMPPGTNKSMQDLMTPSLIQMQQSYSQEMRKSTPEKSTFMNQTPGFSSPVISSPSNTALPTSLQSSPQMMSTGSSPQTLSTGGSPQMGSPGASPPMRSPGASAQMQPPARSPQMLPPARSPPMGSPGASSQMLPPATSFGVPSKSLTGPKTGILTAQSTNIPPADTTGQKSKDSDVENPTSNEDTRTDVEKDEFFSGGHLPFLFK